MHTVTLDLLEKMFSHNYKQPFLGSGHGLAFLEEQAYAYRAVKAATSSYKRITGLTSAQGKQKVGLTTRECAKRHRPRKRKQASVKLDAKLYRLKIFPKTTKMANIKKHSSKATIKT